MDDQEIAERAAQAMWNEDEASQWLEMRIIEVAPGFARMELDIVAHHCNGHGTCHGGISFALADSCFAFACNSYNQRFVGQHNMVSYLRPIMKGDRLFAEGREVNRSKNSGIYDVTIFNQQNKKCVEMRGFSRRVEGTLF